MQVNWEALTMHFKVSGEIFLLQGDPSLDTTQVTLKLMVKTFKVGEQDILLELGSLGEGLGEKVTKVLDSFMELLQSYSKVFEWHNEFLPPRLRDHAIILQPGATLENVEPYRYLYVQKNEIEKLVRDMLAQ